MNTDEASPHKTEGNKSAAENGPAGDRGTRGSAVESQKTSPRANVGDRTAGCAGQAARPVEQSGREEVSAVERAAATDEGVEILTDDGEDEIIEAGDDAVVLTDGGTPRGDINLRHNLENYTPECDFPGCENQPEGGYAHCNSHRERAVAYRGGE